MKEEIVAYFLAEKRWAIVLLVVGIAAIAGAIALIVTKSSYRGMAIPLALVAIGELIVGVALVARTDGQLPALLEQVAREPAGMARVELTRMGPIMRNFEIIKIVELLVLAAGVVMAYASKRNDFAFAIGVGFVAQASLLLVFDFIAARRAERYVEVLRALTT